MARVDTVPAPGARVEKAGGHYVLLGLEAACCLLGAWLFMRYLRMFYINFTLEGSYYSHGFLIPPLSVYLLWRKRREVAAAPRAWSSFGYAFVVLSILMLFTADWLGVDVLGETAFVVLVVGLFVSFQGLPRAFVAWFALFYLFFIIPIPPSITTQITFKLKTIAAQVSVDVLSALGLPLIREGSYIHWSTDRLLVGDVCGGLKSLIALIAFGTFMAYISKTRLWARWVLFVLAGPIAIVVNVLRIMFLAVVGYYYGSDVAGGKVHDVSGIAIFVAAFAVYLALEGALRKYAPAREDSAEDPEATGTEGT